MNLTRGWTSRLSSKVDQVSLLSVHKRTTRQGGWVCQSRDPYTGLPAHGSDIMTGFPVIAAPGKRRVVCTIK